MKNRHRFIKFCINIKRHHSGSILFWKDALLPIVIVLVSVVMFDWFNWHNIIDAVPSTLSVNFSLDFMIVSYVFSFIEKHFIEHTIKTHINKYINDRKATIYTQLSTTEQKVYSIRNKNDFCNVKLSNSENNYNKKNNVIFVLIKVQGSIKDKRVVDNRLYLQLPEFVTAFKKEKIHGKEKIINSDENRRLPLKLPRSGIITTSIFLSSDPNYKGNDDHAKIKFNGPFYIKPIRLDEIRLELQRKY